MSKALRVLCVEDSEEDGLLLLRELRNGGYDPVWERADTAEAMSVALEEGSWDLVLSDFDMPGFSAPAALNLVQQAGLDLPFIVVSGVIGDEQAVAMMKAGAHDYVLKDNLTRLLPAIKRELNEATVRRQRKRAEEALRQSEQRYRQLVDTMSEGLGVRDEGGLIIYANDSLCEMCGYSQEEVIGRSVVDFLDPDSRKVFDQRTVRRTGQIANYELVLIRKDGVKRRVRVSEVPITDSQGRSSGSFGVISDITERAKAEELLRQSEADLRRSSENLRALTARLITAQEEESKRISRELHDDFNQNIAALVIGIETIKKQIPESAKTLPEQLTELQRQAETLSDDVRRVAHTLHPSILDHLGLVVALESYCAEFTQKTGIKTKFTHRNIRRALSKDVALCLYRVVQESLQNVRKHSDAKQAEVSVTKTKGRVCLAVSDDGVGFDTELQSGERGIGLTSMEERVRLVSGSFSVQSLPGEGACVDVRIPLRKRVGTNGDAARPVP